MKETGNRKNWYQIDQHMSHVQVSGTRRLVPVSGAYVTGITVSTYAVRSLWLTQHPPP